MIERDKLAACRVTALSYLDKSPRNETGALARAVIDLIDAYLNQSDELAALRDDAALGGLVRRMPVSWRLSHTDGSQWDTFRVNTMGQIMPSTGGIGDTPEVALKAVSHDR